MPVVPLYFIRGLLQGGVRFDRLSLLHLPQGRQAKKLRPDLTSGGVGGGARDGPVSRKLSVHTIVSIICFNAVR